jgi:hypothetical protein
MSTENQEVTVEPAAEEKTETKEVKGTKRAAEVSIPPLSQKLSPVQPPKIERKRSKATWRDRKIID